jgi:hypothetical protein
MIRQCNKIVYSWIENNSSRHGQTTIFRELDKLDIKFGLVQIILGDGIIGYCASCNYQFDAAIFASLHLSAQLWILGMLIPYEFWGLYGCGKLLGICVQRLTLCTTRNLSVRVGGGRFLACTEVFQDGILVTITSGPNMLSSKTHAFGR